MIKAKAGRAVLISVGLCGVAVIVGPQAGCDQQHVVGGLGTGGIGGGIAVGTAGSGGSGAGGTVGGGGIPAGAAGTTGIGGSALTGAAGGGGSTTSAGGGTAPGAGGSGQGAAAGTTGQGGASGTSVQSWTGYIENYMFPSGSDAIKFAFSTDAAGTVTGTVTLGMGTPPPPATDPNVGYPTGLAIYDPLDFSRSYWAEGYAYPMRSGGTLQSGRMRFSIGNRELWRGWCALQQPVANSSTCLPNWGSSADAQHSSCALLDPTTMAYVPVDCGKLALCGFDAVCSCDTTTCSVAEDGDSVLMFDINIDGARAAGSAAGGPLVGNNNVDFTRDP